ncbi:MAG: B12-binding domain-containing radical SAM protein [Ruminococcaceae bacterium]|nr:B12-binding domain-containing radical SAM protein [Oscillospiraceae bacterium]
MVDYSLLKYAKNSAGRTEGLFPIDAGRGCPFGCSYCSTKTFWGRKYRLKSPRRIAEEIQQIHEHFGATQFNFEHDMFTMNKKSITETCRLIKSFDFKIFWRCSARIDCIDEALIDTMFDAGMRILYIGIETGSARMQKIINKNLDLNIVLPMLSYIRKKGVSVVTSFIYGFPEETEEDISATIALIGEIAKIGGVQIHTHLCTFLAGTELWERFHSQMTPTDIHSNITGDFALKSCMDIVEEHPEVFPHFMEYHTELRSKLVYFQEFISSWVALQPVYAYLSSHYPKTDLFTMYNDFVKANEAILHNDAAAYTPSEDLYPDKFAEDKNYDLILEYRRYLALKNAETTEPVIDAFDILINKVSSTQAIDESCRGKTIVIKQIQNGRVTLKHKEITK